MLEVDSGYPQDLHDLHNGYPLACEKVNPDSISKDMLSGYCNKIAEKYNISTGQVNN